MRDYIIMLKTLYRAGSSYEDYEDYQEFSDKFSDMKIKHKKQESLLEKMRQSQPPVARQFLTDKSLGNCWAVTAIEMYINFLKILRESGFINEKDFEDGVYYINYGNEKIIAMSYIEERKKVQNIILEVQENEPHELLSVLLGDFVAIETNKKKQLTEKVYLYESSDILKNTLEHRDLLEQLEYTIEVITPESYPKTESGKEYLDSGCLQSLTVDYGGDWLMMFSIIHRITKESQFYLLFYDIYYKFLCNISKIIKFIEKTPENVIGFAALNKSHVAAVLKIVEDGKVYWKIVDAMYVENFVSDNINDVFEELTFRKFYYFHIVCYLINRNITYAKKIDSPRKRTREERLSRESVLLSEIESK